MLRALHYCHHALGQLIETFPNGTYLDATLGKGNDTLFILNHPAFRGKIYSFDIQEQAIKISQDKLKDSPRQDQVSLIQDGHQHLDVYLKDTVIQGAIFNLGYLPGGDHNITTLPQSTLEALNKIQERLVINGKIFIMVYSGHPQGQEEKNILFDYLRTWPQEYFQVLHYGFINQRNNPPLLLIIERIKEKESI